MADYVANLTGEEFGPDSSSTLASRVLAYYKSIGGVAHSAFGDVLLDESSVHSDLGHKNYLNKTHSFSAVKEVLEHGTVKKPWAYYRIHDKLQPTGVISANITIAGNPFRMDVVVIGNRDGVLHIRCHDVYQLSVKENRQRESFISKRVPGVLKGNSSRNPFDDETKIYQNNNKTKNIIKLNESDLRMMVKNCVRRILAEYKDNPIFGWNHIEKTRRDSGASDKEIELLHQSYDEFGAEKASKGEIPNDTGFEIWCSKKDAESCRNGKGMRYPDYRG